jgi:hypothetical protein
MILALRHFADAVGEQTEPLRTGEEPVSILVVNYLCYGQIAVR